MIDIKTMNEQYKQCKKIINTLFLVEKTKKLKSKKWRKKVYQYRHLYILLVLCWIRPILWGHKALFIASQKINSGCSVNRCNSSPTILKKFLNKNSKIKHKTK